MPPNPRDAFQNLDSIIEGNRAAGQIGTYSYPLTPGVHNIVLMFKSYSYQGTGGTVRPRAQARTGNTVVLPLPTNIRDSYSVQVGPYELGGLGEMAAELASSTNYVDAFGTIGQDLVDQANRGINDAGNMSFGDLLSSARAAGAFVGRNLLDSLPGADGVAAGVSVGTGTAVNPHVALKFDGVNLKSHSFNWSLSPRNEQESDQIQGIVNLIRNRMLPAYRDGGTGGAISRALLSYPDLVEIYFTGLNQEYFYYFKPAMINSFDVDFSPNGIALNRGGRPAFINMSMTVTEAKIHTRG
jgi:hypothetical protein